MAIPPLMPPAPSYVDPMTPTEIIARLDLRPHPEGGHYRETWAAEAAQNERPAGTCIYFLLQAEERSHWHRVDSTEIWHFYAGDPLLLSISESVDGPARNHLLGPDLDAGELPQLIVPEGHWQSAVPRGAFTLAGCTVSPGFQFRGFELAPPGFRIAGAPG